MPCYNTVPISIIPPTGQGVGPLVWQNGSQINRLNIPQNPSLVIYDGSVTRFGDGSAQAPVYLPNIQQVNSSAITYRIGLNTNGQLSKCPSSNYGNFYDTTTQASAGTTIANLISINTTDISNGISLGTNGKLIFSNAGAYLINLLGQFKFTGGGTGGNITVWYTINGNQPNVASFTFFLPTSNNFRVLANIEDIININVGDYIQFYWWSDVNPAANIALTYLAAGTNPTRPASPSVNVAVSQLN